MSLKIQIGARNEDRQVVAVEGRLDSISYHELDRQITPVIEDAAVNTLVFDLAKLDYISSAGIRSVFRARKALAARGGRVLIVNPQVQVEKVFDIVKAVPVKEIFRSTEELDHYLDRIQKRIVSGDDD
ncbi:MAG TPA: STAS domain-containing protein [Aquimonas sp.]|nr:STAS domain-containing protein [Aquimonas sp.]